MTSWTTSAQSAYTDLARAPAWCSFKGVTCGTDSSRVNYRRVLAISLPASRLEGYLTPLGSLTEMTTFDVSNNKISGSIPQSFFRMSSLEHLYLKVNLLTGPIAPTTFVNQRLMTLRLNDNRFEGRIPESLTNLKGLRDLNTADNSFVGTIPSVIGEMYRMTSLFLGYNYLTGTIPSTLRRLTNLQRLDLGHNLLTGTIPVLDQRGLMLVDLIINYLTMGSLREVPMSTFSANAGIYLHTNCLVLRNPSNPSQNVDATHCRGEEVPRNSCCCQ